MKNIFSIKKIARVIPKNILVNAHKSTTFGDKSLETHRLKPITKFKGYIAAWLGSRCKCNFFKFSF